MDKFRTWYRIYHTEITWFLIGWLTLSLFHNFAYGDWGAMALDALLILVNLLFVKRPW
jgi:hypothetical protein